MRSLLFTPFWLIQALLASAGMMAAASHAQIWQLDAHNLDALHGKSAREFTVFALHDGQFDPVPHQWLEMNTDGLPYFSTDKSAKPAGQPGVIDPSDMLLLRREDGGMQLDQRVPEQVVAEIVAGVPGEQRYYYVVRNAYRQATQRYVKFDPNKMVIKSTDYALFLDQDNLLVWNDFHYRGFQSNSGQRESLLDTLKIRLSTGVFSENARVTLNNKNLEPRIEEIVEGPLAWGIYATTTLHVAKIPVMRIRNYFLLMPRQVDIHARFTLPLVAKTVLQNPSISMSLDGNQLYGGKLVTSWTGTRVAITDGKMSADEEAMTGEPMTGKPWLWFGTGRGFDLLAELDFREGFDQPVRLLYQDDANLANAPERFPGQLPNIGFTIEDLPIGKEFYFVASMYFSENSDNKGPGQYAASTLATPDVQFNVR